MTYREFTSQSAYVLGRHGRTWRSWASCLCVLPAYDRNLSVGDMIPSEAAYHALMNDSDDSEGEQ